MTGEATTPPDLKLGALINPNSRRNRKRPPDLSALKAENTPIEIPTDIAAARPALERLAREKVDMLAISGGDGAVLLAMTMILIDDVFETPPILALIPGGTTNMTAADVGFGGRGDRFQAALDHARKGGGKLADRAALRFEPGGSAPAAAGMFFGAIGIVRAIHFCRRNVHTRGVVGDLANWLTLAPLLLKSLASSDADGILAGEAARVTVDAEALEGKWSLLMASTLDRLAVGADPFWGAGDGLKATFVAAPPRRLIRNAPSLLYGLGERPAEPAYVSRNAERLEIAYSGEVTLDGELYEVSVDDPLKLSEAGTLRFLVA